MNEQGFEGTGERGMVVRVEEALATPAAYTAWLVAGTTPEPGRLFPSRARIVGMRGECERCPIALWLVDTFGLPDIQVGEDRISWWADDFHGAHLRQIVDTPDWVRRVLRAVDEPLVSVRASGDWRTLPVEVRADEVFFILASI